jgi:hypothetical protein
MELAAVQHAYTFWQNVYNLLIILDFVMIFTRKLEGDQI